MNKEELALYVGYKIRDLRKEKGWSQVELGKKLDMGKSTIANYEKGYRSPRQKVLFRIAELFDVSIDDLFPPTTKQHTLSQPQNELVTAINDKVVQLQPERQEVVLEVVTEQLEEQEAETITLNEPLYEYKVFEKLSAGTGFTYFNDGNYDIVFHDEKMDHDFASWVFGDSMEPTYLNGEVVLIKQTGFDYDGAIYAVDWDGQTYIKKVYREQDGLRLVSLNQKYADKFAPFTEDPRIIGKIVGHFQPMEM